MSGREDHVWAQQQATDALYQARRRALVDCVAELVPEDTFHDLVVHEKEHFAVPEVWDRLNVGYLCAEWPPSKLN